MAPAGYRVILDGEAEKILYYTDAVDTPREHWVWAKFPPGVNTFCHSSVDSLHGAEYYPGLNRAILFIHGWLDEKRHWEIIKRSASKYTDYVITFDQLRDHRCMS
jgi:pimeloyl-ACP methyl ester carboxylesterase